MNIPTAPVTQIRGVAFTVDGVPRPQGSKRAFVVKGRAVMTEANKNVKPWRDSVAYAAREAMNGALPFTGPVSVSVTFWFIRPKSVKREHPSVAPDVDKLARTILDGLTASGVVQDDALVIDLFARKRYGDAAGADVTVQEVGEVKP